MSYHNMFSIVSSSIWQFYRVHYVINLSRQRLFTITEWSVCQSTSGAWDHLRVNENFITMCQLVWIKMVAILNSCYNTNYEPVQQTHLQRPLLRMSPTAGDETSRGTNPENGGLRDFVRRRRHRQSGFQHTDRPRPSSPELFNKDHNAGRESLSHLI